MTNPTTHQAEPARLDPDELTAFLRFAAITSTPDTAPAAAPSGPVEAVNRSLVIQGDVAFWPTGTTRPPGSPTTYRPITGRVSVAGGTGGHAHWLIPSGPGVTWSPSPAETHLVIPAGLTVRAHHDAVPVEHADLVIAPGVWSIRVQSIPTPDGPRPAERYRWDRLWRLAPAGAAPTFWGLPINDVDVC